MHIYKNIAELVGHTPLLELKNYHDKHHLANKLIAKLEYANPSGSVKDRIAKEMIEVAERDGLIEPGATIIEPTSGNTGIGLAYIGVTRGYRVIIVMPDTMSVERQKLMKAYGAELVLSDGTKGMKGAIEKANELHQQLPNSFIPDQFNNLANPQAHFKTTGPEIWEDTEGQIDFFVAGVGTGGTITGVGEYLKLKNPNIKIIAVEPANSPVLTEGHAGPHKIQGIGAGFIPSILDTKIYDEVITVSDENAFSCGKEIAKTDGILVGISSGAAIWAATVIAKRQANVNKNIVVLLPDSGSRYLSTIMFDD